MRLPNPQIQAEIYVNLCPFCSLVLGIGTLSEIGFGIRIAIMYI